MKYSLALLFVGSTAFLIASVGPFQPEPSSPEAQARNARTRAIPPSDPEYEYQYNGRLPDPDFAVSARAVLARNRNELDKFPFSIDPTRYEKYLDPVFAVSARDVLRRNREILDKFPIEASRTGPIKYEEYLTELKNALERVNNLIGRSEEIENLLCEYKLCDREIDREIFELARAEMARDDKLCAKMHRFELARHELNRAKMHRFYLTEAIESLDPLACNTPQSTELKNALERVNNLIRRSEEIGMLLCELKLCDPVFDREIFELARAEMARDDKLCAKMHRFELARFELDRVKTYRFYLTDNLERNTKVIRAIESLEPLACNTPQSQKRKRRNLLLTLRKFADIGEIVETSFNHEGIPFTRRDDHETTINNILNAREDQLEAMNLWEIRE